MQVLLDTHALIWWWSNDNRLPEGMRTLIEADDTIVYVSSASALEIAIKVRIGQLPEMQHRVREFNEGVREDGFYHLFVRDDHSVRAGLLSGEHRDPFDRLIAAQALIEKLTVITRDPEIARFGCPTIW
jgi:PIN domain nuclease of toxin-antitoxin system